MALLCYLPLIFFVYAIIKIFVTPKKEHKLNSNQEEHKLNSGQSDENPALSPINEGSRRPSAKTYQTDDDYFTATGKSYYDTILDKGNYGEYLIYKCLDYISGYKKFLFNLYIPTSSVHTTEIDIIMLHTSGIYVFESKNYSGWIFGSEKDRFWTQSIYNRGTGEPEKSRFYNPVLQNENHIRHLKNLLNNYSNIPIFSYVVFSERCQLKKVNVDPKSCTVIKSEYLYNDVKLKADFSEKILTDEMLDKLYNILFPYSKVSEQVKEQHIKDVNEYKELYGTAHYTLPNDQTKNNYSERL